jgi:hypothetical protein
MTAPDARQLFIERVHARYLAEGFHDDTAYRIAQIAWDLDQKDDK